MLRLASGSPRRVGLLRALDVSFDVAPPDIDETQFASPARAKAEAGARAGHVTLAADTMVELDGEIFGKPRNGGEAFVMLATLSGQTHEVRTEVVAITASGRRIAFAVRSRVTARAVSNREIERYVATGEPLDRAGAYSILGEGRRLIASYDGCLANVIGLPLCHVYHALRRAGVVTRERPEVACQAQLAFRCPVWKIARAQGERLADGGEYASWPRD